MLCARRVVRVVHEGDVQSSPFLAGAHVIMGSAPFLAGLGSAPITKQMQDGLWQRNLTNLAVLYGSPVGKYYTVPKPSYQASKR